VAPNWSGPLGRLRRLGPLGIVFELCVDDLEMFDPSVECLELLVRGLDPELLELPVGGLDPEPFELSLSYTCLDVVCEYTDAMEGSGEIAVFGNSKGVYSSDVEDGRRLCCVSI